MGLFKSQEQKQLEARINDMDRFCGSLKEYDNLKGCEHVVMDTGRSKKYVFVDQNQEIDLLTKLLDEGCTGFIGYVPVWNEYAYKNGGYGTPIKRK